MSSAEAIALPMVFISDAGTSSSKFSIRNDTHPERTNKARAVKARQVLPDRAGGVMVTCLSISEARS
jgi:hypothetical protein